MRLISWCTYSYVIVHALKSTPKGRLSRSHSKFLLCAESCYVPSQEFSTARIFHSSFMTVIEIFDVRRDSMISGGQRHRQRIHSLHFPRLDSASEIPSLRSTIPDPEYRVLLRHGLRLLFCFLFLLRFFWVAHFRWHSRARGVAFVLLRAEDHFALSAWEHLISGISQYKSARSRRWTTVKNDSVSFSARKRGNKHLFC